MPMSMPSHIKAEKAGNTQKEISHILRVVVLNALVVWYERTREVRSISVG